MRCRDSGLLEHGAAPDGFAAGELCRYQAKLNEKI